MSLSHPNCLCFFFIEISHLIFHLPTLENYTLTPINTLFVHQFLNILIFFYFIWSFMVNFKLNFWYNFCRVLWVLKYHTKKHSPKIYLKIIITKPQNQLKKSKCSKIGGRKMYYIKSIIFPALIIVSFIFF